LPEELRQSVLGYCSKKDLVNFACCSQICATFAKPLLWRYIGISINRLGDDFELHDLKSLKFTTRLRLFGRDPDDDGEDLYSGLLLAQVLRFCDPSKIDSLIVYDIPDVAICHLLGIFKQVKNLCLGCYYGGRTYDWMKIADVMPALTELKIHCEESKNLYSRELEKILDKLELRSLMIKSVNQKSLNRICKEVSLKSLSIRLFKRCENLASFAELVNLVNLTLEQIHFSQKSMDTLYQDLPQLQTLVLEVTTSFTDAHFQGIDQLKSLRHLRLTNGYGSTLSGLFFKHIGSMKTLSSLWFLGHVCKGEELENLTHLNEIQTLKKITVNDSGQTPDKTLLMILHLNKNKVWKVSTNLGSAAAVYYFTH